jgi:16S rRNA (cytidine1402-2'-O)-methyltransferase
VRPPGRLFVVGTPIGNLGDLTPRAVETLRAVEVVAAEDTRVTRRLLAHAGIHARLLSYRDANEAKLAPELVRRMSEGQSVALVTDAGTPAVSDPGYRLVRAAAEAGIEVVTVPGPSAVIALLSISGLPTDRFSFEGFPRTARGARAATLEALRGADRTVVFYESPRRVVAFLREIAAALDDPAVAVGRELTKLHEEVLRGRASEVADRLAAKGPRGELAIAVHIPASTSTVAGDDDLTAEVRRLVETGLSARDIVECMKPLGVPRRRVYDIVAGMRRAGRET